MATRTNIVTMKMTWNKWPMATMIATVGRYRIAASIPQKEPKAIAGLHSLTLKMKFWLLERFSPGVFSGNMFGLGFTSEVAIQYPRS